MVVALRLMLSSRGMSSEVKADLERSSGVEKVEKTVNSSSVVMESEKMEGDLKDFLMEDVMGSKK